MAEISPKDRVLLNPELMETILKYCTYGSNLNEFLNLRLVCSIWKACAFRACLNFFNQLPTITDWEREKYQTPYGLRERIIVNSRTTESFVETFKSTGSRNTRCDLPLKLEDLEEDCVRIFKKFASNIVSFHLQCVRDLHPSLFTFKTSRLMYVKISTFDIPRVTDPSYRYYLEPFRNLLIIIKHLVGDGKGLKKFELVLYTKTSPENLPLDILPSNLVTGLNCGLADFEYITNSFPMENLREIYILDSEKKYIPTVVPFLQSRGDSVIELEIENNKYNNQYQVGSMKNLQVLKLRFTTLVSDGIPLSTLMPKLRKLDIDGRRNILPVFLEEENRFMKVDEIRYMEQNSARSALQEDEIFPKIASRFPNLTTLDYCDRSLTKIHTIFSHLDKLSCLKLRMPVQCVDDLFRLLTDALPEDIPEDTTTWTTSQNGNLASICNMKNLQLFELTQYWGADEIAVPPRESEFLFTAVFGGIRTLQTLTFGTEYSFNDDCVANWVRSGRQYVNK